MSKSRVAGLLASASLLLTLFVVLPGMGADEKDKEKNDTLYRPLGLFTEVLGLVRSNYVEPVELKPLLSGAFAGMTEALDPFSEYVPPDKMSAFAAWQASKGKKDVLDTGIVLARRFGFPVVVAAIDGSPAAGAGVKSDDVIEKLDGQLTRNMALWELDAKLSGKAGGRVRLEVVREGKPRHRTIDILRTPLGAHRSVVPARGRRDGHPRPLVHPGHGRGHPEDPRAARQDASAHPRRAQQCDGLLRRGDARRRPLREPRSARGAQGPPDRVEDIPGRPGERVHDSRLVVLVDSGTAGAAELFASALREATVRAPAPKLVQDEAAKKDERSTDFDPGLETAKGAEKLPCGSWARRPSGWDSRPRS